MPRTLAIILDLTLVFVLVGIINYIIVLAFEIFLPNSIIAIIFIAGSIVLVSLTFLVSMIMAMKYHNRLTRFTYHTSAIGMGIITYLFLASILYLLSYSFTTINPLQLGVIYFGAASIVSLYGIVHSRRILTKYISVTLSDLPNSWKGRKVVWISDVHVGQVYGAAYIDKIVAIINAIDPAMVFIGGDLFDGSRAKSVLESVRGLSSLKAPLGTYFIAGNHEEFGDNSLFLEAVRAQNIRILDDEIIDIDGLQIIGADYARNTSKNAFASMLKNLTINKDKPSILLKHEPSHLETAMEAGVSFQISGHTHKGQIWPLSYLGRMMYGKYIYGLNTLGSMQVYTSSGVGLWGPPLRVGSDCEIVCFEFVTK